MRRILWQAMQDPEHWVVALDYCDTQGRQTRRVISPIRFTGSGRFLALCLCREAPRQFYLERCDRVSLQPASDILMPVAVQSLEAGSDSLATA